MSTQENDSTCSLWRRQCAPIALLVAVGTAISVAVFFAAYAWERRSIRHEFDSLAEDRFHAIGGMFDESVKLLDFADNVFMIAPRVDSPEFADYVRSLKALLEKDVSRYPALHALIWAPRVPRAEMAAYERAARAVFAPNFRIGEASDSAGSGAQRPECFPGYLCITAAPGRDQPVKDLALDPAVWKAMERARDTGVAATVAPMKTSADANDRFGYRVFQPLYHGGDPGEAAARRRNHTGFLCIDLDVGKMVDHAFIDVPPVGVDVSVCDDTDANRVTVCRHASRMESPAGGGQGLSDELKASWTTKLFGRKVTLQCCTAPSFWVGRTIWQPWLLLCGGLALTLGGAGYRYSQAFRAATIERTVATRIAAFCRDAEQKQQARRRSEQTSPPAESTQDELHELVGSARADS
jgi:hypothetical protein